MHPGAYQGGRDAGRGGDARSESARGGQGHQGTRGPRHTRGRRADGKGGRGAQSRIREPHEARPALCACEAGGEPRRARSSAILTGVSTVLADDPSLNVRDIKTGRQPLRVVVDSRLRMPTTARMLRGEGKTLVVTASQDMMLTEKLKKAGAEGGRLPT